DVLQPLLELLDSADDVEALARAAGAGDHPYTAIADTERLQHLIADANFFLRLGRERNADGVADAAPQQHAQPDRALDRSADQPAGLGDAEVQRAIELAGQLGVGSDGQEHV